MQEALFTQALGLQAPWQVNRAELSLQTHRVDIEVGYSALRANCPRCAAVDQPLHDRRARKWRHLDFFQFEAWISCNVPRVNCGGCGQTSQLPVPWAREGSHFTLMFEAFALSLVKLAPVTATARLLRCSDGAIWRQIDHYVEQARAKEDHSGVRIIGIDETACARGHSYITVVHDLTSKKLLFATEGKDAKTVAEFCEDLKQHQGSPEQIEVVCMDMSKAFQAGVAEQLGQAAIAFDGFHVVQLANKAVDETRKEEVREHNMLKKSRWGWLKDESRWSVKQQEMMQWLTQNNLRTAKAWRLKETLRDIYKATAPAAIKLAMLTNWLELAQASALPFMVKLAKTVRAHWAGIVKSFEHANWHTGYVEAMNAMLQQAKARAKGYGTAKHFISIAYLIAGKLEHLPMSPYQTVRRCELG